jgi:glucose-6-phosphate dehydrogenase assembly protein OpcA
MNNDSPETIRIDEREPLKVSDIEKGLSDLWSKAASRGPQTDAPAELRVCTMSLLVYVPDEPSLEAALDAAQIASQQHPMRVVYMRVEPEPSDAASGGQISGVCQITTTGNVQVCCEQIVLRASGKAVDQLPAAVTNLIMPDLPVVFWWMGQPAFDMPICQRLESVSDFLLVDSKDFPDAKADLEKLSANIHKHGRVAPGDLNWLRISEWRESAAELFNGPELVSSLDELDRVEIGYGSGNPAQAMLFAGWLSSRLGWSPLATAEIGAEGSFTLAAESVGVGKIVIALSPLAQTDCEPGTLCTMRLQTKAERNIFTLALTGRDILGRALRDSTAIKESLRPIRSASYTLAEILSRELSILWPDPIYQEALNAGTALMAGRRKQDA